jgi:hypothetical protein
MSPIRFILLVFLVAVPSLASAETMNFEQATAILGASCGKDIDDNCRGVNLDPIRLKECFLGNGDRISSKCQGDYRRPSAPSSSALLARYPFEAVQLGNEPFVLRQDPTGSRQGSAVPVGIDKKVYAKLQQGD